MTQNEILTGIISIASAIIGYSSKYIGSLLNKKKDDTILGYKIEMLEKNVAALEKWREEDREKIDKIAVIEERIKHL
jgi:chaperonin cofactor prefoldin